MKTTRSNTPLKVKEGRGTGGHSSSSGKKLRGPERFGYVKGAASGTQTQKRSVDGSHSLLLLPLKT